MPSPLRVLVAGGGVAALEASLALQALAGDRVRVETLAPSDELVERPWSVLTPFTGTPAPRANIKRDSPSLENSVWHRGALAAVDVAAQTVTTTDGGTLGYDRLIVAPGARRVEGVPGAVTFRGAVNAGAVEAALRGAPERVLFVAPPGCGWPLPVYELALLAAREYDLDVTVVSYEPRPLDEFGVTAADAVARVLDRAGVEFLPSVEAVAVVEHALVCADGRMLGADAIVALPVLRGPAIAGLPTDPDGFIVVDGDGRVPGAPNVFAAGDATTVPIKQGGLAAQQADTIAGQIATELGAPPRRARRVLRAVLLTDEAPLYLRRDLDDDRTLVRRLRSVPPHKILGGRRGQERESRRAVPRES
jgi:sulfide:quinone oxidoreductase